MYAKLFASLYQGTLRGCPDEILVFTNLLAHADVTGVVDKHWRAIAEECGISRERVEAAIAHLEAPDPESRSPDEHGRRIIRIDEHRVWGWRIVNHGKYRAIRDEADRREQNRLAQERWREKNKPQSAERKQSKPHKPPSAHTEAEAEAEADTEEYMTAPTGAEAATEERKHVRRAKPACRLPEDWRASIDLQRYAGDLGIDPESTASAFTDYWHAENGPKAIKRDWDAAFRTWCRRQAERPAPRGGSGFRSPPDGGDVGAFARAAVIVGRNQPVRE